MVMEQHSVFATPPPAFLTQAAVGDKIPAVLEHAYEALCAFQALARDEHPKAHSLYEGAKNLVNDTKDHVTLGRKRIKGETDGQAWTKEQVEQDMDVLMSKHKEVWQNLKAEGKVIQSKLEASYKEVLQAKQEILDAAGFRGPNVAWMHFLTPQQTSVRKVYHQTLSQAFQDAEREYLKFCGGSDDDHHDPQGLLTSFDALQRLDEHVAATKPTTFLPEAAAVGGEIPEVLERAHEALCAFQNMARDEYPKASSLYEGAKNVVTETKNHVTLGRKHMKGTDGEQPWTMEQVEQDMDSLTTKHQKVWQMLKTEGKMLQSKLEASYKEVLDAKKAILDAAGFRGPNVAWMHFLTPQQSSVRKVYTHNMIHAFQDAELEYLKFCGYPHGLLTSFDALERLEERERSVHMEKLHKMKPRTASPKVQEKEEEEEAEEHKDEEPKEKEEDKVPEENDDEAADKVPEEKEEAAPATEPIAEATNDDE